MPLQGLELPMGPSRQDAVDVPKGWVKSRLVVTAIIVDPATDVRVEHPRQIIKRLVAALMKRPAANCLSNLFESFVARRWAEHDAKPMPSARQSRPERVAEKIELLVAISSAPIIILAVDNLCLLRMKCQPAFSEPHLKRCAQCPRLLLTATMADSIVGIALEGDGRMVPVHPQVERIMQKEIRQEGADDPALRRPSFSCDEASILHLLGRLQPSLDVQECPRTIRMFADRTHQQI